MSVKEDFSAEDDVEGQETFESAAKGELERLQAKLAYEHRRGKVLYRRSVGRKERIRLKAEYGWN